MISKNELIKDTMKSEDKIITMIIWVGKRFELLMYACKRENILKFVSSEKLSEPYNKIFNNDCLFCITAIGNNAVRPSISACLWAGNAG